MELLTHILLWFSAISVGIMAGVYFTFSAFVMRSLDAMAAPSGMLAMQSINRIIVKSSFLPLFFGSTLTCVLLSVLAGIDLAAPGAVWALLGGAAYVVGMFVVTIAGNVPLNNRLEATLADGPDGPAMWAMYMKHWVVWNHVRTLACIASAILLVMALIARG